MPYPLTMFANPRRRSVGSSRRSVLTLAAVRSLLRMGNISIARGPDGEYGVKPMGAPESQAYYTMDLTDALDTGRAMVAARPGGVRANPTPSGVPAFGIFIANPTRVVEEAAVRRCPPDRF